MFNSIFMKFYVIVAKHTKTTLGDWIYDIAVRCLKDHFNKGKLTCLQELRGKEKGEGEVGGNADTLYVNVRTTCTWRVRTHPGIRHSPVLLFLINSLFSSGKQ